MMTMMTMMMMMTMMTMMTVNLYGALNVHKKAILVVHTGADFLRTIHKGTHTQRDEKRQCG